MERALPVHVFLTRWDHSFRDLPPTPQTPCPQKQTKFALMLVSPANCLVERVCSFTHTHIGLKIMFAPKCIAPMVPSTSMSGIQLAAVLPRALTLNAAGNKTNRTFTVWDGLWGLWQKGSEDLLVRGYVNTPFPSKWNPPLRFLAYYEQVHVTASVPGVRFGCLLGRGLRNLEPRFNCPKSHPQLKATRFPPVHTLL